MWWGIYIKLYENFNKSAKFTSSLSPIYSKLTWLDRKYQILIDKVYNSVSSTYFSIKLRVVFETRPMFPSFTKDRFSCLSKISLIYKFKCQCETEYLGRTSVRLETKLDQHIPKFVRLHLSNHCRVLQPVHDSAIGTHLLENEQCSSCFTLHISSSKQHLQVLEAVYLKLQQPSPCRRKENLLRSLHLFGD